MGRKLQFRRNVAAILEDAKGRIFIGQRSDRAGAWQFPQGGVDKGESDKKALYREVKEEIGVSSRLYQIKKKRRGYRYVFPDGRLKNGKYSGQEQVYYHCSFRGRDKDIKLDGDDEEFNKYLWIAPKDFKLDWVPDFKKEVYRSVFRDFFNVKLK